MKTSGLFIFTALISISAHADNAQDFAKLNSSLDAGVEQTAAAKTSSTNQQAAAQQPNSADPNLIAPIRKQGRAPAREGSTTFGD